MSEKIPEQQTILISGSDQPTIAKRAEKLVENLVGPNPDPFVLNIIRLTEGRKIPEVIGELLSAIQSPSLFRCDKVVWLKDFPGFSNEGTKTSTTADAKAFQRLVSVLERGFPRDIRLIMSGPGIDKRKSLAKTCQKIGAAEFFETPDPKSRDWQMQMGAVIKNVAQARGVSLPEAVIRYMTECLGVNTERIEMELEKLIAYCGDEAITLKAAQEILTVEGEISPWQLTNAIGERNLAQALEAVQVMLEREPDGNAASFRYILQIYRQMRDLLQIRLLMFSCKLRSPDALMSFATGIDPTQKEKLREDGFAVIDYHPFRLKILGIQAIKYEGQELVHSLAKCRDANLGCFSTGSNPRVVLEKLVLDLVGLPKSR